MIPMRDGVKMDDTAVAAGDSGGTLRRTP